MSQSIGDLSILSLLIMRARGCRMHLSIKVVSAGVLIKAE